MSEQLKTVPRAQLPDSSTLTTKHARIALLIALHATQQMLANDARMEL